MARDKELIDRRNEQIKTRLAQLEKRYPKWRFECYVDQLSAEFYLSVRTIENIITGRNVNKKRCGGVDVRQMNLF